jgi:hypothetical protein
LPVRSRLGDLLSQGDLKSNQTRKNRLILRGTVGVWNCESSDYIKGCDGACILAVGFLAGADGWSVTNVAAFTISRAPLTVFTFSNFDAVPS